MNKKYVMSKGFIALAWMALIAFEIFGGGLILSDLLVKASAFIFWGGFIPYIWCVNDEKICPAVAKLRGIFMKHQFRSCGKNLHIGKDVKFGNRGRISFGNNCNIADHVVFAPLISNNGKEYASEISIGNNVHFGTQDRIACKDSVVIEDNVLFAAFVHVTDHSHEYHDITRPVALQGVMGKGRVVIKEGAWLAFGCHILSGVTVGEHAVVAANSVVTKDVPAYSVVAGNPAQIISRYNFENRCWEKCDRKIQ